MAKPRQAPSRPQQVVVASARRIDLDKRGAEAYRPKAGATDWQRHTWTYFDIIPEVKQSAYFLANTLSLVRLFVAHQPDPEQDPVQVDDTVPNAQAAVDFLDRLKAIRGGIGGMIRQATLNLKAAGEFYLVGIPERPAEKPTAQLPEGRPAEPEQWQICSVSQLNKDGEFYILKSGPTDQGKRLPADAVVIRIWQPHPEFPEQADCALRGTLLECEELALLTQAVKATARSRIAGAGFLLVPDEVDISAPVSSESADEPSDDPFMEMLVKAMVTPIAEEGDASAVVPVVLRGQGEALDRIRHLPISRPLDAEFREQRKETIHRLASGMDIPIEEVEGLGQSNHWSGWLVDQSTWNRYGQPVMLTLVEALTTGFLQPGIEASEVDPDQARQLMIWFDPAGAIIEPDLTATANEGHDRLTLSDDAWRTASGFSDEDAPSPEERQRRIEEKAAMRGSAFGRDDTGGATNPGATPQEPPATDNGARLNGHGRVRSLVAASRSDESIGRRLYRIDSDLRSRLEEGAEAAVRRALTRAGARVGQSARKQPNLTAAVKGLATTSVASHLGRTVVAGLGFTEDELVGDSIEEYGATFDAKVRRAQARVRSALRDQFDLDDAELAEIERRQDDDRSGAWAWFSAALVGLATERLYDPDPAAPATGEVSADLTVPNGIIREAMERAGGAGGALDAPPGGVALGQLVMATFGSHGQVVDGWEWVYGDSVNSFPGHEVLDGTQFTNWEDDVLAVSAEDDWLGVSHYRPGDHAGCACDFIPLAVGEMDQSEAVAASVRQEVMA